SWHAPEPEVASAAPATQPTKASDQSSSPGALAVLPYKPAAGHSLRTDGSSAKRIVENASEVVDANDPTLSLPSVTFLNVNSTPALASESSESVELPPIVVAAASSAVLENLTSSSAELPNLQLPISKGVTQAVLLHKVNPVYPATALAQRLDGSVVLEAS